MDEDTLQRVALDLREQYPDDDDFAAAMGRLEAQVTPDVRESLLTEARKEGEVWRGPSGRWFTVKGGRTVPAEAPGGGAGGPAPPRSEKREVLKDRLLGRAADDAKEDNAIHGRRAHVMARPEGGSFGWPERKQAEADVVDALDSLGFVTARSYWLARVGEGGQTLIHAQRPGPDPPTTLTVSNPADEDHVILTGANGRSVPILPTDGPHEVEQKVLRTLGFKRKPEPDAAV
jgi:hypothetical protein